jgi:NTE family protein
VGSHGLYRLVHKHLPYRNLEDAKVKLHIVASTAIPAAFAPVKFNGLYLADGAITSCTPVKVAVMRGATRLIVLPTGYACAREMPPHGAVANALHALTLLISRQIRNELESLEETIAFHVAPPLCPLLGSPYDFSQTAELIERAAARTEAWLAEGGLERREIPHEMNAHKHS